MAKGKTNALRAEKKPEDAAQQKTVPSQTETKENKPATRKTPAGKRQSILQKLQSSCKPRSPLSDSSSMLIQEGNDSAAAHPDMMRLRKELPSEAKADSCESREQEAEPASHSDGVQEQSSDQHEHKESVEDKKVQAPKSQRGGGRRPGAKKTENKAPQNRKVTDYFPIRRSNRTTEAKLKNEEHRHIDDLIKNNTEEGIRAQNIEGKGRGVVAIDGFKRGDFVVEYHGDLLELTEAKLREEEYAQDPQKGCYMYYFQYCSKTYCVDATKETGRLGRLINHSKSGNCQTRLHPIDGVPHLILVASRDIRAEEELLYDYGDRSKASISAHPWLKQ